MSLTQYFFCHSQMSTVTSSSAISGRLWLRWKILSFNTLEIQAEGFKLPLSLANIVWCNDPGPLLGDQGKVGKKKKHFLATSKKNKFDKQIQFTQGREAIQKVPIRSLPCRGCHYMQGIVVRNHCVVLVTVLVQDFRKPWVIGMTQDHWVLLSVRILKEVLPGDP